MSISTSFTVSTAGLKDVLNQFKRLQKKYFITGVSKIRVMPNGIEVSGLGLSLYIPAESSGLAEVFAPLKLLYSYVQDSSRDKISFTFRPGEMECGASVFSLPTIKVETLYYNPDIVLPVNPNDFILLQLGLKYGDEYMQKNNLLKPMQAANAKLQKAIHEVAGVLQPYLITENDIRQLVLGKLRAN